MACQVNALETWEGGGYESYGTITHERAALASAALIGGPRRQCCPCPDAPDTHVAGRLTLSRCFGCAMDEDRRVEWPQVPHGCLAARRHRAISCRCRAAWGTWPKQGNDVGGRGREACRVRGRDRVL